MVEDERGGAAVAVRLADMPRLRGITGVELLLNVAAHGQQPHDRVVDQEGGSGRALVVPAGR